MNRMIDPRDCRHFRDQAMCPNWDQEIMVYLDNRVITDMDLTIEPQMFDKAFEFCASCAHFAPLVAFPDYGQAFH